ncbi:hypothetical protein ACET3X_003157 [Alternaria dauci]|uniref:Uncharacterized protein n=1 Tax=Alternaria dauci TaxID=48095 RepID=A0ABR3US26_9PLEO
MALALPPIDMSTAKSSPLESIPPEILTMILEESLTLTKNEGCMKEHAPASKLPRGYGFLPRIQPQVLRLNKSIHAFASEILDRSNRWIIFNMDCADLLIARVTASTGMIIVDPESAQALPTGMMHVRVKLYTHASVYAKALSSRWPAALPKRQILLVPASNIDSFLNELRGTELSHAVRVMPGKTFQGLSCRQKKRAVIGVHGLSICIHVSPNYPANLIGATLEKFRILHGPLNVVSIVGAPDEQQARLIETSITARRDAVRESTFSEALMHVVQLFHHAERRSKDRDTQSASSLYDQAREIIRNNRLLDRTPWAGYITEARLNESRFELLIMSACTTNWMVHNIIHDGCWRFKTATEAQLVHVTQSTEWLLNLDGPKPEFKAYLLLLSGLHIIFSCRITGQQSPTADALAHGMDLINMTQFFVTHMSRKEALDFRVAYKMNRRIDSLEPKSATAAIAHVVKCYKKWFSKNLRPIKWRVHESFVSQPLRNRGMLERLWKMPSQPNRKLDRYRVIDTFEVEEGTEREYYLL